MNAGSWKLENWVIVRKLWLHCLSPCDIELPTPANHFLDGWGNSEPPHRLHLCFVFTLWRKAAELQSKKLVLSLGAGEGQRQVPSRAPSCRDVQVRQPRVTLSRAQGNLLWLGTAAVLSCCTGSSLTVGFICVSAEGQVMGKRKGEAAFLSSWRMCRLPSWRKIEFLEDRAVEKGDNTQWSERTWSAPVVLNCLWNERYMPFELYYFEVLELKCTAY